MPLSITFASPASHHFSGTIPWSAAGQADEHHFIFAMIVVHPMTPIIMYHYQTFFHPGHHCIYDNVLILPFVYRFGSILQCSNLIHSLIPLYLLWRSVCDVLTTVGLFYDDQPRLFCMWSIDIMSQVLAFVPM